MVAVRVDCIKINQWENPRGVKNGKQNEGNRKETVDLKVLS